jgi:hypothetical protein
MGNRGGLSYCLSRRTTRCGRDGLPGGLRRPANCRLDRYDAVYSPSQITPSSSFRMMALS